MRRRNFMAVLALMALAGGAYTVPQALAADDGSISGTYSTHGRNLEGDVYEGVAEVEQTGSAVDIHWTINNHSYSGSGEIDGRVVTVFWGEEFPVVYVVMDDGELHGTWGDGLAFDKMTPE